MKKVCDKLGIPFYPIWYRDEFRAMVMDKFVDDYEHGRTVYEINFYQGGFEYDYDVDAETGAILKFEKDFD